MSKIISYGPPSERVKWITPGSRWEVKPSRSHVTKFPSLNIEVTRLIIPEEGSPYEEWIVTYRYLGEIRSDSRKRNTRRSTSSLRGFLNMFKHPDETPYERPKKAQSIQRGERKQARQMVFQLDTRITQLENINVQLHGRVIRLENWIRENFDKKFGRNEEEES